MSEHSWYITFWVAMGAITVSPIYILLYLIYQRLGR